MVYGCGEAERKGKTRIEGCQLSDETVFLCPGRATGACFLRRLAKSGRTGYQIRVIKAWEAEKLVGGCELGRDEQGSQATNKERVIS